RSASGLDRFWGRQMTDERNRRLQDPSWEGVAVYLQTRGDAACALVPVGAVEAHGRHAPLGTDNYIAGEIAERLADRVDALVMPGLSYGPLHSDYEIGYFPGSISVSPGTLISLAVDVGTELARH